MFSAAFADVLRLRLGLELPRLRRNLGGLLVDLWAPICFNDDPREYVSTKILFSVFHVYQQ